MDGVTLKNDIYTMKDRLDKVEADLKFQVSELIMKEELWNKLDSTAEQIKTNEDAPITFNICGKKFTTRKSTLLNTKDTLFYRMIISRDVNIKEDIFFDRSPKYFGIILDFLRTKKISLKRFKTIELDAVKREAEYFEINEIIDLIGGGPLEIELSSFEFSGPYMSSGILVGTNKIEDLSDISMMKGICAVSPGWIIIELNGEWEINGLEVGGYKGNTSYWGADNGTGASIKVSTDKVTWSTVGTIPSSFGVTPKTVTFSSVSAKYIKFDYTSYLGIGYLRVNKI
jgi:hypothetical protein